MDLSISQFNIGLIVLMRHGTAQKNIENRHGGLGSPLTESGASEIYNAFRKILELNISCNKVLYIDRLQCEMSAKIAREEFGYQIFKLDSVRPINLGVLDGLSDQEVHENFPQYGYIMDQWRAGGIEINQLNIPGITDCYEYYSYGVRKLNEVIKMYGNSIIIGTRSNLVLFGNILLGNNPSIGGNYKEIKWPNAGFLTFMLENECSIPILNQSSFYNECY